MNADSGPSRAARAPSPAAEPSPVYVICGPETFLRRQARTELLDRLGIRAGGDFGLAEYDGEQADLAAVLDDVRTPALLAVRRVVLVHDADAFITAHRAALERFLSQPCDCGVLVLECRSFAATTRLHKCVAALGGIIRCESLKRYELPAWVARRARAAYGCRIDSAAAQTLLELAGNDLDRLDTELSKLATYVGSRRVIAQTDLEDLVGATRVELVFGVTDAVARRDARGALELWDRVLANDREAPFRAVGGLAWGVRRLVDAKRIVAQGGTAAEAVGHLRIRLDPATLSRQLKRLSLSQWENMLIRLLQIDVASKSAGGDVRIGVEKFITQASGAA